MSQEDKLSPHEAPLRHWTTLAERQGDPDALAVKNSEFYSKPEEFLGREQATKYSLTDSPNLISEAAGFLELKVKQEGDNGFSRRDFLKFSGAAMVFATAGCGLRPAEKIVPYVNQPEEITLGVANYYASAAGGNQGIGVLVKTREGRPIKIEGNPTHPLNQGKLDARTQYEIFNLYDPDRLTGPVKMVGGTPSVIPWSTADSEIAEIMKVARGRIALLTGTVHGPARNKILADFCTAFDAKHYMYDGWSRDASVEANAASYGTPLLPTYKFDQAEYVISLESDFLGSGYSSLEWSVAFGKNRHVRDGKLSKLVCFDSFTSQTSANADERFRLKPGQSVKAALAIADELLRTHRREIDPSVQNFVSRFGAGQVETDLGLPAGSIARIANELGQHAGNSIVIGGESLEHQIVACLLNSILGNDGKTVDGVASSSNQARGSLKQMTDLLEGLNSGEFDVLITFGTNPAYSLPESLGMKSAFAKAKTVVHLGDRADETGRLATYLMPGLHWLEGWGDAEPVKGLYSVIQPTVQPLHDCRGAEESLLMFAQAAKMGELGAFAGTWHDYVMAVWQAQVYSPTLFAASFHDFWNSALRDGYVDLRNAQSSARVFNPLALASLSFDAKASGLQVVVVPSPILGEDGNANNSWCMELPHPVAKVCWTNFASLAPKTASAMTLRDGDYVKLTVAGKTIEVPVRVQPGDVEDVVTVQTGWGREHVGRVGDGVGGNAFALCSTRNGMLKTFELSASLEATGHWEELPDVQGHNYTLGRPIIQEATFDEYLKDPHAGKFHEHELNSLWPEHEYKGNKWGMAIDQTACIGCNACIAACSVENNIPVVGATGIRKGREMHWIRVDRYFSGTEDDPEFVFQPMLCQHCDNASCETVCPVVATVHSSEGLNMQIYNRCVGTRYCSNNCPYKVRRFNFFEFSFAAYEPYPLQLALNPEVTVREKGIMEKCTFCQQRIREGKEHAKEFGRTVLDSDIQTACQQSCPTGAITFGNTNNPDSNVSQRIKDPRSYHVIAEVNTKPQVAYYTKLRNRPGEISDSHAEQGGGHHA